MRKSNQNISRRLVLMFVLGAGDMIPPSSKELVSERADLDGLSGVDKGGDKRSERHEHLGKWKVSVQWKQRSRLKPRGGGKLKKQTQRYTTKSGSLETNLE